MLKTGKILNNFFNFLRGYVIIEITGPGAERFVNICLRRGIKLGAVTRHGGAVVTSVGAADFKRLADVRRKCGVRLRIAKKRGPASFARRYRKRAVFALCAALTAAAVYQTSRHIWAIEINGVKDTDITKIAALLEENGLYIGAPKDDLPPIGEIKAGVLQKYPDVTWLWVYMEGSKARVEIAERRIPAKIIDKKTPCDIVSRADGVIKQLIVKSGEAKVRPGDAVSAGDVLISGTVRAYRDGEEEKYLRVHSLGEATAYTMHTAETTVPVYDEIRTPTGAIKRYLTLEIFGKKYDLFRKKAEDYADYDIKTDCRELRLPLFGFTGIALTSEKHIEVNTEREYIGEELAAERARDALEEQIAKELTLFAEKTDERLEYEKADDDTIRVRCTMSFTESIGTEETIRSE